MKGKAALGMPISGPNTTRPVAIKAVRNTEKAKRSVR
jgi:hypothetical protein